MSLNTRIRGAQINLSDASLVVADDSLVFYDATDGVIKREAVADFVSALAGQGIIAGNGVLSINPDDVSIGFSEEPGESETLVVKLGTTPGLAVADGLILDVMSAEEAGGGDYQSWIPYADASETGAPTKRFRLDTFVQAVVGDGLVYDDTLSWNIGIKVLAEDNTIDVGGTGIKVGASSLDASHFNASGDAGQVLTLGTGDTLVWTTPSIVTEDYIQEAEILTENVSSQIEDSGYDGIFTIVNAPILGSVQVFLNGLLMEAGGGKDYTIGGTGNKDITFVVSPVVGDIVIIHYIRT